MDQNMQAEFSKSYRTKMLQPGVAIIAVVLTIASVVPYGCQQPPATSSAMAAQQKLDGSSQRRIIPKPKNSTLPANAGVRDKVVRDKNGKPSTDDYRWDFSASPRKWKYIVIHHTATDRGSVASIHQSHLQRKDAAGNPWRGIGYHFVVGNGDGMDDGEVEATFRWDEQTNGAHAGVGDYNSTGIGICLVGNFEEHAPSPNQMDSLKTLIQELQHRFNIDSKNIVGHKDVKSTKCPGKYFPFDEITSTLKEQ